jgi:hypothetical protein
MGPRVVVVLAATQAPVVTAVTVAAVREDPTVAAVVGVVVTVSVLVVSL